MKKSAHLRSIVICLMVFCLLFTPVMALGKKGEKNFKQGIYFSVREQWDKAVEEFALALAASPGNVEYQLHYRRSLFNASQLMMQRGRNLADQKDYAGAYNAFRLAYGYDPVNELAKAEMDRMLRLQKVEDEAKGENKDSNGQPSVRLTPTSYRADVPNNSTPPQDEPAPDLVRSYKFSTPQDLQTEVRRLARDIGLNVIFDSESFRTPRTFKADFEDVTTAQILDFIFLQEGLFFQRVGKRTILVATGIRRQQFQQLVLRTFYLSNASPDDVKNIIGQAIPPQPGRQTQVLTDKSTNSITVRDTSENIKLIASLIKAMDKDRAEVVIDVSIYEVSKSDLLRFGNQIGGETTLTNLGGTSSGIVGLGGNFGKLLGAATETGARTALGAASLGAGLLIPQSNIQAFQSKGNARILASTQIHAFNNEASSARIGQRVPVQTASVFNGGNNTGNGGNNGGNVFGGGFPVINYEQVGLTLEFKPLVFPNQDVQMEMKIESKDVVASGATPTFSERTIKGTARVQNNRTLLLASVAQDTQSNGRAGLPLLGSIPILGRLFAAPTKENRQVDIVIAVTPRVLRAPTVHPEDEQERITGSIISPTSGQVAELMREVEREEQYAAARRLSNTAVVQVPDQPLPTEAPKYVAAKAEVSNAVSEVEEGWETVGTSVKTNAPKTEVPAVVNNQAPTTSSVATTPKTENTAPPVNETPAVLPKPIDASKGLKTLNITPTVDASDEPKPVKQTSFKETTEPIVPKVEPKVEPVEPKVETQQPQVETPQPTTPVENKEPQKSILTALPESSETRARVAPNAELLLLPPTMKRGEVRRIPVMIKASTAFKLGVLSLNFDPTKVIVRQVLHGEVFGSLLLNSVANPFVNSSGMLTVSFAPTLLPNATSGILAYLEIEALQAGKPEFKFDGDAMRFATNNGESFRLGFVQ